MQTEIYRNNNNNKRNYEIFYHQIQVFEFRMEQNKFISINLMIY